MPREVSCRSVYTSIRYAEIHGKDISALLDGLPFDLAYLSDTHNWIPRKIAETISQRMTKLFDDDEIIYKVALSSEKMRTLGFLDNIARIMVTPAFVIRRLPTFRKYFTKVDDIEVIASSSSGASVRYYTLPGFEMTANDCYFTKGLLTALPSILKIEPVHVWEEMCSVPIHKKGRINGKRYSVDSEGYVSEHEASAAAGSPEPRVIGRLNDDGTFKLGETLYGTPYCLHHVSWPGRTLWAKRLFYEIFTKPKVLAAAVDTMQQENDLIESKYNELNLKNLEIQKHAVDTITSLMKALDAKDRYTKDHSLKVSRIAVAIAKEMHLTAKDVESLRMACRLHDIGKIGIKDEILLKPGALTEEEWNEIKKHPALGEEIVKPLTFLGDIALLVRQDHERWDGKGYPDGLKGTAIDLRARIMALADAYDALISGRSYKKAFDKATAVQMIRENSGLQFDPAVVNAFLAITDRLPPFPAAPSPAGA